MVVTIFCIILSTIVEWTVSVWCCCHGSNGWGYFAACQLATYSPLVILEVNKVMRFIMNCEHVT